MDSRLENYDWEQAFELSGINLTLGATCGIDYVQREDVKRVIALRDGCHDGDSWLGIFELYDGRFAFICAGCCYTGWDCQGGGNIFVAESLERLVKYGLGDEERTVFANELFAELLAVDSSEMEE